MAEFQTTTNTTPQSHFDIAGYGMPAIAFNFVVLEMPGKEGFLVRHGFFDTPENYLKLEKLGLTHDQILGEFYPEKYGLIPKKLGAPISPVEHILGQNLSPYISTSSKFPGGAGFEGKKVYIDIAKLKSAGVKIISTEELTEALKEYKKKYPHLADRIDKNIEAINNIEGETLLSGEIIPAEAIFTPKSLALATIPMKFVRVVGVIGIVLTAYDLEQATEKSVKLKSARPITAEVIRQAGGWGAARAGFAIGGSAGAALGVETGPGLVVTGLVGGIIFGVAGYYGANWAANRIAPDTTKEAVYKK